jgi:hypothetical protein
VLRPIPTLVELYDAKRTERLAADKVAESLHVQETALKQELINAMLEASLTVAGNATVSFTMRKKERYQTTDWPAVYAYITQNQAFDLLQRRLNEAAVAERGDVPGVELYEFDDLSRPQKVK